MALIAHTYLPRSMFDMDSWFRPVSLGLAGPSTLDMFDPFDDLDRVMCRNLMWLDKPAFLDFTPFRAPRVPKKYRVSLDCEGYNAESIKTEVKDGKLVITGSEGSQADSQDGDFSVRQFRKSYPLPEGVEADKLVSFLTSSGKLIVEMPIKPTEEEKKAAEKPGLHASGFPQIVEGENGQKNVAIKLNLPKTIDPSKLSVTCKDRDLIVQAENVNEKGDSRSQTFYYQRTTLPENTDLNALKCMFEGGQLSITAPLHNELKQDIKTVPIEFKNNVDAQKRS
jgi:HSP20 family molecular chaperone IbpA